MPGFADGRPVLPDGEAEIAPLLVVSALPPTTNPGISLVGRPTATTRPVRSCGMSNDCHQVYAALVERGVRLVEPPNQSAWGGEIRCFLQDPDGHLIEFESDHRYPPNRAKVQRPLSSGWRPGRVRRPAVRDRAHPRWQCRWRASEAGSFRPSHPPWAPRHRRPDLPSGPRPMLRTGATPVRP